MWVPRSSRYKTEGWVHGVLGLIHFSETAAEAGCDLFGRFGDLLRSRVVPLKGAREGGTLDDPPTDTETGL